MPYLSLSKGSLKLDIDDSVPETPRIFLKKLGS
jgi:hypothetical protein